MAIHAEEATTLYARLGNQAMEADCLSLLANARMIGGQPTEGVEIGWRAVRLAQQVGTPWGEATARLHLAGCLHESGCLEEALAVIRRGQEIAGERHLLPLVPYLLSAQGAVERALGRLDEAQATHEQAVVADSALPSRPFAEMVHGELCADYVLLGQWEAAHREAQLAARYRHPDTLYHTSTFWHEMAALCRGGELGLAREGLARFEHLVTSPAFGGNNPRFLLSLCQAQTIIATAEGRHPDALAHLEQALALARQLGVEGEEETIRTVILGQFTSSIP
jgi:tetratricopeptide (TPR) repeat protein